MTCSHLRQPRTPGRRTWFIPVGIGLLAALGLVLTACRRPENAADRGVRDQVLHRSLGAEIPEIDPQLATTLAESQVVSALFEGLLIPNPDGGQPLPGVAESWMVSPDGLIYTFRLRSNARWSDGSPLTADDFVSSFRRALSPELASGNANLFFPVRGANAYRQGEITDFSLVGFEAVSDQILTVSLESPCTFLPQLVTHWSWMPVPIAQIGRSGPVFERGSRWTRMDNVVSNGPFTLVEWVPNQAIRVRRNPNYWEAKTVRLNEIVFHAIDSVDAEERAFRAGQLHITEALPLGKIDTYRETGSAALRIEPFLSVYFYRLNVTHPALRDVRVRRALSLSIDRKRLVDTVLRGAQLPADSFTPRGIGNYLPPSAPPTNPERARRLLAEAGFPDGDGFPPLEILFNTSENHRLIAEAIQEMWRRELGISALLLNQELRVYLENRKMIDYEICRSGWVADYLDPMSFLGIMTTGNPNNQTGWSDPEYDRLILEAERETNRSARQELFQQAEQLLLADVPVIPIYHYSTIRLVDPRVKGWVAHPLDQHPYKFLHLEPLD
ncbi:MAG: peptide ABC transporter substrate-binding protein [Opitutaceae bacterium]